MEKRTYLLVDSPINDEYHYHLYANIPNEFLAELGEIEMGDFVAFEKFYFSHKDQVELQFFVIDMVYWNFLSCLDSLIKPKSKEERSALNQVLDKVYLARAKNDNRNLINNPNTDLLLAYLDEIQNNSSMIEEEFQIGLVSRCVDLKNAILQGEDFTSIISGGVGERVLEYSSDALKEQIEEWSAKEEESQAFGMIHFRPEEDEQRYYQTPSADSPNCHSLELLQSMGENILVLLDQVIYRQQEMTEEDEQDFLNLWLMVVSIDFKTVLPSSFFDVARKLIS